MKRDFLSKLEEAIIPEITPGPIDILVIRAVTLIRLGFQEAFRALRGWKRQHEPVYVYMKAIRNNRSVNPRE